jgi:hypothetical protein
MWNLLKIVQLWIKGPSSGDTMLVKIKGTPTGTWRIVHEIWDDRYNFNRLCSCCSAVKKQLVRVCEGITMCGGIWLVVCANWFISRWRHSEILNIYYIPRYQFADVEHKHEAVEASRHASAAPWLCSTNYRTNQSQPPIPEFMQLFVLASDSGCL